MRYEPLLILTPLCERGAQAQSTGRVGPATVVFGDALPLSNRVCHSQFAFRHRSAASPEIGAPVRVNDSMTRTPGATTMSSSPSSGCRRPDGNRASTRVLGQRLAAVLMFFAEVTTMHTPLVPISLLLVLLAGAPALALAQPSSRVDRGVSAGHADATVVWLTPRVAYAREVVESVCWRGRCAPVVARQTCRSPDCPASGWQLATSDDVAEVPRWRTSEWVAQMTDVLDDARGAELMAGIPIHPPVPRPSRRWGHGSSSVEASTQTAPTLDCARYCGDGIACTRVEAAPEGPLRMRCEAAEIESPIVWLTPDTAFADTELDSACYGERCAPVVLNEHCRPPQCPGMGNRVRVAEPLADVVPWPAEADASDRMVERVRADPRIAPLRLQTNVEFRRGRQEFDMLYRHEDEDRHLLPGDADSPSPTHGWPHRERPTVSFEIAAGFAMGSFVRDGGTWVGASLDTALQLDLDTHASDGDGHRVMEAFLFDSAGLAVRAQVLSRADGPNQGDWLVSVAGGVALSNRLSPSGLRLPTLLGALVPDVGAVLRNDTDASAYLSWSLPLSWVLLPNFGFDVRPRVQVVFPADDSVAEPDVFIGVTVGLISPMLGSTPIQLGGSWGGGLVR